ncbi:hypothetical protein NDU88_000367 [Pleurodeles waltl]|uniref:Uncharacterized protein n=1 Tax=Pleurodeles waltl TaxID=8319 RepID=A0AAV7VXB4_PLEWA|nr:hypothetical protein NDU88_000367 [Pleurodeles waltl]
MQEVPVREHSQPSPALRSGTCRGSGRVADCLHTTLPTIGGADDPADDNASCEGSVVTVKPCCCTRAWRRTRAGTGRLSCELNQSTALRRVAQP